MRRFGVEEELLLVDAVALEPLPSGALAVALNAEPTSTGHELTTELKQEQLEVISPPQQTLTGQLEAIRTGRALAEEAAAIAGGRVAAMSTAPGTHSSHRVSGSRNHRLAERFGITATEQLTNGFHIHVATNSCQEAVTALDRIRVWLPSCWRSAATRPFGMASIQALPPIDTKPGPAGRRLAPQRSSVQQKLTLHTGKLCWIPKCHSMQECCTSMHG